MSPFIILSVIVVYLAVMAILSWRAGRGAGNEGFFIGDRRNSWWEATLAVIGAAMSGVTFISVPGSVATDRFSYMQMVIGFTIGQMIVAFVLIPMFYRRGVISLYEWLDSRFGVEAHKVGAWCFLVAKLISAALKIYVVCIVLQVIVFDYLKLHFIFNIILTMSFVWLFTRRGGVRSLIVTDVLQSLCLVAGIVVAIIYICRELALSPEAAVATIAQSPYSQMWFFDDPLSSRYFWKMVAGGALCLVAMTGLDQDMMQRNMSCRTQRDSQINIILTAICQIVVILLFLSLGVLLYAYAAKVNLSDVAGDNIFAAVAINGGLPMVVGIAFILGLISSTYSAAGSALTSLTTSFTIDVMGGLQRYEDKHLARVRGWIHIAMAVAMAAMILLLHWVGEGSVINLVFKIAGYTYGPILGMFVFGMVSRRDLRGKYLLLVAVASPILSYLLQSVTANYWNYHIGFELLGYNALFTIFGLLLISYKQENETK